MNFFKKIILLFLTYFFLTTLLIADGKIVFLDLDYLLSNSVKGKIILSELEKINQQNINEFDIDKSNLKKIDDEIKQIQNIASPDELKKKIDFFRDEIKIFEEKKINKINIYNETKDRKLNKFLNEVTPIVKKFMEQNSIELLFDKKNIFISNSDLDITQEILFLIDKK